MQGMIMDKFLEVTLKTTLVFIAACVVTRLLERSSAAIRHLVWAAAAVLALTFPAAVVFGPAWQLPLWPRVETMSFVDASAPIEPSGESSIAEVSREIAKACGQRLASIESVSDTSCHLVRRVRRRNGESDCRLDTALPDRATKQPDN